MLSGLRISAAFLVALALSADARIRIIERDGRAIFPRRFGQEQCGGLFGELGSLPGCPGNVCGTLAGAAISKLLAASPVCDQQDHADAIIDAARAQDADVAVKMIDIAVRFRQCEKNTPPDFTTNPPTLRNSLFCQKAPKNAELDGLVQAQDPANDPNLFFDPATKTTVTLGAPGTIPFGGSTGDVETPSQETPAGETVTSSEVAATTTAPVSSETPAVTETCPAVPTVTVTVTAGVPAETEQAASTTVSSPAPEETGNSGDNTDTSGEADLSGALDFGTCTDPTIEFGPAFEGRALREFTFKPVNKAEFPQGSALNGNIVTNAVCNILKNNCKAPQATVDACEAGKAAFAAASKGAAADAFNSALGIKSNFANVPAAPGGGPGSVELATTPNFNKCSPPTIIFAAGIDGRAEESFVPENRNDFTQGSALNGNIVTRAVCDTLVNKCDANQVAIDQCTAAQAATAGLSGQAFADAFNAVVLQNVAA
ncbi:hypothetical protein FRC03_009512 [Tulasnella sp. 419]|nr:hypothetical protein FRC03_009512 [Tulasnella sp. 419]